MKLIIAGSRHINETDGLLLVKKALRKYDLAPRIKEIVSGRARGIDRCGEIVARNRWPVKLFPADWDRHGFSAGPIRNRQMAEYADALLAVWDGQSSGTRSMINIARELELEVHVYRTDPKIELDIYSPIQTDEGW